MHWLMIGPFRLIFAKAYFQNGYQYYFRLTNNQIQTYVFLGGAWITNDIDVHAFTSFSDVSYSMH